VKQEEVKGDAAAAAAAAAPKEGGETKVAEEKGEKKADAKQAAPAPAPAEAAAEAAAPADPFDSLTDLISAYATEDKNIKGGLSAKDQAKKEKKKK
jgi:hypothetical protein